MGFELQSFEEDVIKASHQKPILVDFWAPWCGPCQTLGPIIEKLALEQADRWTLVKINSDNHQDLSRTYEVKGIPAVKLFFEGKVIDEFTGVLPEYAIKQWLDKALPTRTKKLIARAENLLEEDDPQGAIDVLEEALRDEPLNATASGLLAGLIVFSDPSRASDLARTAATGEPRFMALGSAIEQISACFGEQDFEAIKNEKGFEHYQAAVNAVANKQPEMAIQNLIEVLKTNRYVNDDGARKLGVALFTVLGAAHPITLSYRRTFDMWLY